MIGSYLASTPACLATSFTPINKTQVALLLGGVLLVLVASLRHRSRSSAGKKQRGFIHPDQDIAGQSVRELEAVMLQLDQLSRQIHAKIDVKLATLQKLIREADLRIDQVAGAQRDPSLEPKLDIHLGPENPGEPLASELDPHEAIYRLADSGRTPLQIARELSRHAGEVELILSLRRAKRASSVPTPSVRKQAG